METLKLFFDNLNKLFQNLKEIPNILESILIKIITVINVSQEIILPCRYVTINFRKCSEVFEKQKSLIFQIKKSFDYIVNSWGHFINRFVMFAKIITLCRTIFDIDVL